MSPDTTLVPLALQLGYVRAKDKFDAASIANNDTTRTGLGQIGIKRKIRT